MIARRSKGKWAVLGLSAVVVVVGAWAWVAEAEGQPDLVRWIQWVHAERPELQSIEGFDSSALKDYLSRQYSVLKYANPEQCRVEVGGPFRQTVAQGGSREAALRSSSENQAALVAYLEHHDLSESVAIHEADPSASLQILAEVDTVLEGHLHAHERVYRVVLNESDLPGDPQQTWTEIGAHLTEQWGLPAESVLLSLSDAREQDLVPVEKLEAMQKSRVSFLVVTGSPQDTESFPLEARTSHVEWQTLKIECAPQVIEKAKSEERKAERRERRQKNLQQVRTQVRSALKSVTSLFEVSPQPRTTRKTVTRKHRSQVSPVLVKKRKSYLLPRSCPRHYPRAPHGRGQSLFF
jgi:hypothetical protein